MDYLPAIFALIVAAAGWFYLFYSRAAQKLGAFEPSAANRLRIRLRRIGGVAMMLLALAFYLGSVALEREKMLASVLMLLMVFVLLCTVLILGLVDLYLTNKLRKRARKTSGFVMSQKLLKTFRTLLTAFLISFALLTGAISCGQQSATAPSSAASEQPQSLPTVTMTIAGHPFILQVAGTEEQQNKGLMFVDSMAADHGMIFSFTTEEPRAFWMKNTHIPLDIVYLDHQGKVVSIVHGKPYDLTSLESVKPAKFVIELNVGTAERVGLKMGDAIQVPPEVAAAAK